MFHSDYVRDFEEREAEEERRERREELRERHEPLDDEVDMKTGYHFTADTLRNGEPIPPIGEWLIHDGPVVPCGSGLHMCEHPLDALVFAPGFMLHSIELDGELQQHGSKWVGRRRRRTATIDATNLLDEFARWCALQVIHVGDPPEIVRSYLETGDQSAREAAGKAAWEWLRSCGPTSDIMGMSNIDVPAYTAAASAVCATGSTEAFSWARTVPSPFSTMIWEGEDAPEPYRVAAAVRFALSTGGRQTVNAMGAAIEARVVEYYTLPPEKRETHWKPSDSAIQTAQREKLQSMVDAAIQEMAD